jgi:hypothetical protein
MGVPQYTTSSHSTTLESNKSDRYSPDLRPPRLSLTLPLPILAEDLRV